MSIVLASRNQGRVIKKLIDVVARVYQYDKLSSITFQNFILTEVLQQFLQ